MEDSISQTIREEIKHIKAGELRRCLKFQNIRQI